MHTTDELNPFTPAHVECPYPVHDGLRETGVHRLEDSTFLVSRYEDVEYVLMHPELYSNLVGLDPTKMAPEAYSAARYTGALPASDLPEHNYYRTIVGRALSAHGVRPLEPRIREIVDGLIDAFIDSGEVELIHQFGGPLTVLVFVEQMGIPDKDVSRVKAWVDCTMDAMSAAVGMLSPERTREVMESGVEFRQYLLELAHDRRLHPKDDLLSTIVTSAMPGLGGRQLDDRELQGMLVTMLMGGTETTLNMIGSGMWLLLTHPAQLATIQADLSLLPGFIEESLRVESPVQGLFRRALVDSEVADVHIPAGSRIFVMYGAANGDPSRFEDPRRFDISRADAKEHMAFGAGVHYCVGAPLARMEGRVAFEQLLTRLKNVRFSEAKNDFGHGPSHVIRGFRELWLTFDR